MIRSITVEQSQAMYDAVMGMGTAGEVRSYVLEQTKRLVPDLQRTLNADQ
jgi:hypothetical protein